MNEVNEINKVRKNLFLENEIKNYIKSNKRYKTDIHKGKLKYDYFIFGTQIKTNSQVEKLRNKATLTGLIFSKDKLDRYAKEIRSMGVINPKGEVTVNDVLKKWGISLYHYKNLPKGKKRLQGGYKVIAWKINEIEKFIKYKLKINLTKKEIEQKKHLSDIDLSNKVLKEFFISRSVFNTIKSKYLKQKIIIPLGRAVNFKKSDVVDKKRNRGIFNYYPSNEIDNMKSRLIKRYAKKIKGFDKTLPFIFNNSNKYLKSKKILQDRDLINFFKIKRKGPFGIQMVRNLRKFYNLKPYCYIKNMGFPAYGTMLSEAIKFKKKYGTFIDNPKGLISHLDLQKISFFRNQFCLKLINKQHIKSKGFNVIRRGNQKNTKMSYLIEPKEVINFILKNRQKIKPDKYDQENKKIIDKIKTLIVK